MSVCGRLILCLSTFHNLTVRYHSSNRLKYSRGNDGFRRTGMNGSTMSKSKDFGEKVLGISAL